MQRPDVAQGDPTGAARPLGKMVRYYRTHLAGGAKVGLGTTVKDVGPVKRNPDAGLGLSLFGI